MKDEGLSWSEVEQSSKKSLTLEPEINKKKQELLVFKFKNSIYATLEFPSKDDMIAYKTESIALKKAGREIEAQLKGLDSSSSIEKLRGDKESKQNFDRYGIYICSGFNDYLLTVHSALLATAPLALHLTWLESRLQLLHLRLIDHVATLAESRV